jgi:Na+/proline symporter
VTSVVVILVLSPVLVYLVAALLERRQTVVSSEFFLAANQVSSFEFANSSIGYGFQIASVSIFFAWGYLYGFGALVNPVFWGVGIVLFGLLLPRMSSYLGSGKTLHGYLGERYNSRSLEVLASIVTLIAFLGTFVAELAWGGAVFKMFSSNPAIVGAILTGMAIVIAIYLGRAGQLNAMRTDQVQLVFTYFGFLALGVSLIWLAGNGDAEDRATSFILSFALALCLVIMSIMIWRQVKLERRLATSERFTLTQFVRPALLVLLAVAVFMLAANLFRPWPDGESIQAVVTSAAFFNLSQGTANLLALALLPLFWQFVDVTMWQRLAAVQLPPAAGSSLRERLRPIRVGLQRFAFESPVTWLFAIIVGIALRHAPIGVNEETIWDGIGNIPIALMNSQRALGEFIGLGLALAFGAAIVAAMLSTADSMLMGALAVFSLDLAPKAKQASDPMATQATSAGAVRIGRIAIIFFTAAGLGIIWLQLLSGMQVLPILLGAYAAQLSLAASVLATLLLGPRPVHRGWALTSIFAGVIATGYATVVALGNEDWALYAPLFALGASAPIYITGLVFFRRSLAGGCTG